MRQTSRTWLLLSLLFFSALVSAKSAVGGACDQRNTHLDTDTYALDSDCEPSAHCADNGTCLAKGCRRDTYPFGYTGVPYDQLPPKCPEGSFCPDEGDQCLPLSPVGGSCQKDRDDECTLPPNFEDLSGYLNVNGSICLNFTCQWANATVGQSCINDNTVYTAYTDDRNVYAFIVSRDNCANGMYCDGTALQCFKSKPFGASCTGHKECLSYNCEGTCGKAADESIHPGSWTYVVVGVGLFLLIVGVMMLLWFAHRRSRKENQIRLEQYYNEQIAYRQSIISMSHAKNSLFSLPPNTTPDLARQSLLGEDPMEYTTATDMQGFLAQNDMRRVSSSVWSEADSDALLVDKPGIAR